MTFGILNIAGGVIMVLILIPNILYAIRNPQQQNKCENRIMNLLEQIGRYASMALMVLPLGVWKFAFPGLAELLLFLFGNAALLIAYWAFWWLYFRSVTPRRALMLAVLPSCIFLLTGLTLRHWLLVISAIVFGAGHVYVTRANHPAKLEQN